MTLCFTGMFYCRLKLWNAGIGYFYLLLARCHHFVGSQPWKARLHHQFDVFLLATSTTTGPTVTKHRVSEDVFVTTRVDGNNAMLAGSPRTVTDRLQRVLNAAARIVSGTRKFDRSLTHLLHSEIHWLDVAERIQHKLGVTVHRCLQGKARSI